ncbi:MAG TPA: transcriptional repressor LexA [Streptosporangiaceae bacterium]|nr:transcriptional repressor LexA [Streptosporangiaceae bacterium]
MYADIGAGSQAGDLIMTSADAPGQPDHSQPISPRQLTILRFIRESVQHRGYPPSLREIAQAVGLASQSTVSYHLSVLVRKGYLSRSQGLPRTTVELPSSHPAIDQSAARADSAPQAGATPPAQPGPRLAAHPDAPRPEADDEGPVSVPLIGRIAAGVPITAQEEVEDTFLLPRKIVGYGTLFMLRVAGDSMINAGIADGDYVIIRQQKQVVSGDIVAALIEGLEHEATVKTFQQTEDGQCWLMPHNPAYAPVPGDSAQIMGRVVAVLRTVQPWTSTGSVP